MHIHLLALTGVLFSQSISARCYDPSPAFPLPDYSVLFSQGIEQRCYDPSPAFPLPGYSQDSRHLKRVITSIEKSLKHLVADESFATSSYSIEITSSKEALWSSHYTARDRNETRPGARVVDGDSVYRIASITKTFTTLGILKQHAAGNLSLDDPISKYIAELQQPQVGNIPWKDITLRTLASQLSGIPRDFAQSDLRNELDDPTIIGLPPVSKKGLIQCDEYNDYVPCGRKEFLDSIRSKEPVYAPNQKSTYSNLAFNLLGLALENVTGFPYSRYIEESIFKPLNMTSTSLEKPEDSVAVLPKGNNYWDIEEGIQRPTGGIYSSSTDLSRYLRYILTHYNAITPALNWLQPSSYSTGMNSFFGMPWEIYQTAKILPHSERPVTFVTKSGGLPGYFSIIMIVPDYDLGVTILVGGNGGLLGKLRKLTTVPLIKAIERTAFEQMEVKYGGTYASTDPLLNSSLTLVADPSSGLKLTQFVSNGTNILASPLPSFGSPDAATLPWHAQLVPTQLYRNQTALEGELWRSLIVIDRLSEDEDDIWDDFCTTNIDPATYAGAPINEMVFWSDDNGKIVEIELPAFRATLKRLEMPMSGIVTEEGPNTRVLAQT